MILTCFSCCCCKTQYEKKNKSWIKNRDFLLNNVIMLKWRQFHIRVLNFHLEKWKAYYYFIMKCKKKKNNCGKTCNLTNYDKTRFLVSLRLISIQNNWIGSIWYICDIQLCSSSIEMSLNNMKWYNTHGLDYTIKIKWLRLTQKA